MSALAFDVVIVGGGHAGSAAAVKLRQAGFGGSVAIIGDETVPPYERPPLSKDYLSGALSVERLFSRLESFWDEQRIALLTGRRVTLVEPDRHRALTDDGATVAYGRLVWAAGGSARRLGCPGADGVPIHTLRSLADADSLRQAMARGGDAVVIGGGFIGLEAAAVLRRQGRAVTVLEAADHVLARVSAPVVSDWFATLHRREGVSLLTRSMVRSLSECPAGVRVDLDGGAIEAAFLVAGVGIVPNIAPLADAGANLDTTSGGVLVDDRCRSSLGDVHVIGDCAAQPSPFAAGATVRLESIHNANEQAGVVAADLTGTEPAPAGVPWFWSNQFDARLQIVGLSQGWDEIVVRGAPESGSFSVAYMRDGRLAAVDCVNAPKDFAQARRLVLDRTPIDPYRLADAAIPLKEMAPA